MKLHEWMAAVCVATALAVGGCAEPADTGDAVDTDVEAVDPEAEVEVTPEGEADVELDPEVTPQEDSP